MAVNLVTQYGEISEDEANITFQTPFGMWQGLPSPPTVFSVSIIDYVTAESVRTWALHTDFVTTQILLLSSLDIDFDFTKFNIKLDFTKLDIDINFK